jgi:PrcB C-terminal
VSSRARRTARIACFLAALGTGGCTHPSAPSTKTALALVRFRTEAQSFLTFSGYEQPQTVVVRDRDTWVRVWNEIYRRLSPTPPLVEVDFSKEMVILAALGTQPSSGFEVLFTSASESDGVVTVEVEARTPGPRCVTLTVLTSPLDLARVPTRSGTVLFHTTPTVINCP